MYNAQAVNRVGPAANSLGVAAINRAFRTPAAVDGSASWTIPGAGLATTGGMLPGCWVSISNIGTALTDLLVVAFGRSGVTGGTPNAISATDFVILPGTTQEFWCDAGVDTVKFGGPVTAIASHYRSCL